MKNISNVSIRDMSLDRLLNDTEAFPEIDDHREINELAERDSFVMYLVKQGINKNEALAVMNHPKNREDLDSLKLAEQALILKKEYGMPDYIHNGYIIADRGFEQTKREIGSIKKLGAEPNQIYFIAQVIDYKSEPEILDIAKNIEQFKDLVKQDRFLSKILQINERYALLRYPERQESIIRRPVLASPEETENRLNGAYYTREGEYKDDPFNRTGLSDMNEPGKVLKFNHGR